MKFYLSTLLIMTLSFSGSKIHASISITNNVDDNTIQNSLVLTKINSNKSVEIASGQEIKIWCNSTQTIKGEYVHTQDDQILLNSNGAEELIPVKDIQRIKVTGPKPKLGQLFLVVGTGLLVLGGISLIAGLAAIGSESIGAIILVAVPFLGGGGWGLRAIGSKLNGKTFNLTKKWRIGN